MSSKGSSETRFTTNFNYNPNPHNYMGGKVNLYLDDESLDRWHSLPRGIRSQVVRQALLNQKVSSEGRDKLLIQEKIRKLSMVEKELAVLMHTKEKLIFEITELEEVIVAANHKIPRNPGDIKCLTEKQPFASACFHGRTFYNSDSNRTISVEGGWYAFHAGSMRKLRDGWILSDYWPEHPKMSDLPKGTILGMVRLGPRETTESASSRTSSDPWIHPGFMYCHEILEVHPFQNPVDTGRKYGSRWSLVEPDEIERMHDELKSCGLY